MATSGRKYLLKILSGPNQGAEAPVGSSDLTIGSADSADIILGDTQVAPQQLQFTFSGDSISVVALAPGAYLQGKPLKPKAGPSLVLPYQFITVGGGTQIVLGPAAESWPSLSASDAPPLQKDVPPTPKPADKKPEADKKDVADKKDPARPDATATTAAAAAAPAKPDAKASAAPTPAAPAAKPAVPAATTTPTASPSSGTGAKDSKAAAAKAKQPPPRYMLLIYAVAGALLLLVTILLLLYWTQPTPQSMAPLTGTGLKTLLETRIKDLQLASLIKVQTIDPVPVSPPASGLPAGSPGSLTPAPRAAEGQVRVTGYVATDAERSALYNALAPSLGRAQFEVYSQENILSQSADILRQLSIPLRLTVEGPGTIKAEGTIVSRASWQRALVFLKRDIRGLNQVQERLVALPELIDEIKKILTDARIDNSVRVEGTIRQLTAVGTLADNRSGAWQVAKKSIIEKTTGWVQFTDQVQLLTPAAMAAATGKPEAAPASPLSLEIQGVSSTPAFVTLKNGQTYFPGALLPNGYTLVAIRENQLILNRETERISLNLSDMTWQQIPTP